MMRSHSRQAELGEEEPEGRNDVEVPDPPSLEEELLDDDDDDDEEADGDGPEEDDESVNEDVPTVPEDDFGGSAKAGLCWQLTSCHDFNKVKILNVTFHT